MQYYTLSAERNRALRQAWRGLVAAADKVDPFDVCRRLAEHPAPRYYVSEDRAYDVIAAARANRGVCVRSRTRRHLYRALSHAVDCVMRDDATLTLREAVAKAIYMPAPSFFMTPGSIYVTLSIEKHAKKQKS